MLDWKSQASTRSLREKPTRAQSLDEQRGIVCRSCGSRYFRVVYTRPKLGGKIMRRRECRHCGKRITTWES